MEGLALVVVLGILAVLAFDFTNGFHDASNMIATLVAARAMSPLEAVAVVGVCTFLGPLLGGTAVADTLGGVVTLDHLARAAAIALIVCALTGAIGWNVVTWRLGLPSSSSHALVGGLVGAVAVGAGPGDINWGLTALGSGRLEGIAKVLATLLTSPLAGFAAAWLVHRLMRALLAGASFGVNRVLARAQWLTAALLAFAHGTNDAQKGMAIITLLLLLGGRLETFAVPLWVMAASAAVLTLGTLFGGWRIVRTLGYGIYRLRPLHGFDTQLAAASVVFGASLAGGPVSTTHVVASAIMGVGAAERPRAVRWGRAGEIALAWLVTLPGAALLAAAAAWAWRGLN